MLIKTIFGKLFNLKVVLAFLLILIGWYANSVYSVGVQNPFSVNSPEQYSPADRIQNQDIKVYSDGVYITLKNAELANYADTNSMDPFIDKGATGIEIIPNSESEIKLGDIIAFGQGSNLIIHRVIKIGEDDYGKYFVTKGDNNTENDGIKVRFDNIKYILVGVLY